MSFCFVVVAFAPKMCYEYDLMLFDGRQNTVKTRKRFSGEWKYSLLFYGILILIFFFFFIFLRLNWLCVLGLILLLFLFNTNEVQYVYSDNEKNKNYLEFF